jgi:hypothetical protein
MTKIMKDPSQKRPSKTKSSQPTPISSSVHSSDKLVCLAEITSPHGVRGAVKIKSYTQNPEDIFDYPELEIGRAHV